MARITIEDCLDNVDNRFQLVLVATKRARQILLGAEPMIEVDKHKPTVTALREIADGLVTRDILNEQPAEEEMLSDFMADLDENGEAISTNDEAATADVVATAAEGATPTAITTKEES